MTREPMVLDSEIADHFEELLEALSEGYHINAPDEDKREQYETMLEQFRQERP